MYTTPKRIELEFSGRSDLEDHQINFKTRATGTFQLNSFRSCVHTKTILTSGMSTSRSTTTTFHVQSLNGAKIFFCFPIFSIFGALASETCIISCYYTPDRRTFLKSLRGAQKSRVPKPYQLPLSLSLIHRRPSHPCIVAPNIILYKTATPSRID